MTENLFDEELEERKSLSPLADAVIKRYVAIASGAGTIPIPFLDVIILGGIQFQMIKELSKLYGVEFKESMGKAIISVITTSTLTSIAARGIGRIPRFGAWLSSLTMGLLAGASTYGLGLVFKNQFESGGDFLNVDLNSMKSYYKEKTREFKDTWKETKEKAEAVVEKLTGRAKEEVEEFLSRV